MWNYFIKTGSGVKPAKWDPGTFHLDQKRGKVERRRAIRSDAVTALTRFSRENCRECDGNMNLEPLIVTLGIYLYLWCGIGHHITLARSDPVHNRMGLGRVSICFSQPLTFTQNSSADQPRKSSMNSQTIIFRLDMLNDWPFWTHQCRSENKMFVHWILINLKVKIFIDQTYDLVRLFQDGNLLRSVSFWSCLTPSNMIQWRIFFNNCQGKTPSAVL